MFLLSAGLGALPAVPARADRVDGLSIEGRDTSRLLPPKGALVTPYENNGYRLRWRGDEVEVEVTAAPLASRTPFRPPSPGLRRDGKKGPAAPADPLARLALRVTTGSKTQVEAASRLLNWVARNIEYSLDREAPQSAAAVLARRSGYCTGIARLTVALLKLSGIEAREVAGYIFSVTGGRAPGFMPAQGYHRWIEIHYPDVGWVFSDPLTSHNWVPASYLRLGSEQLDLGSGVDGLLLERQDQIGPVDLYPGGALGVRARRNSDRQLAGALSVQVEDFEVGLASLEGVGPAPQPHLVRGTATFVGLDPGQYRAAPADRRAAGLRAGDRGGRPRAADPFGAAQRLARPLSGTGRSRQTQKPRGVRRRPRPGAASGDPAAGAADGAAFPALSPFPARALGEIHSDPGLEGIGKCERSWAPRRCFWPPSCWRVAATPWWAAAAPCRRT